MKIGIDKQPYLDPSTGLPLEGRMSVYMADSDVLADVFVLEGTDFVQTVNPLLIHGGHLDDSLFVEAGLYRLKLERYTGPSDQMSAESPDEYFEQCDVLEVGTDFNVDAHIATQVDTVDALRSVDPAMGAVTVKWYSEPGDCVPRTYIWDADSLDSEDGGYVIGSDISDSGNWILAWDDEILPCSVYGVKPNDEGNMNLLLGYPSSVGSFHLATAPCVRFLVGTYRSNVDYTTTKELVFDAGATFPYAGFTCPRARVLGNNTSYLADFIFTATDASAHSSWFRSVNAFWNCGAKYFYLDTTNYFFSSVLTASVTLTDKVIVGSSRISMTYASGRYIALQNTTVVGRVFSKTLDYVRLMTMYGDEIFSTVGTLDPGLISAGHHTQYDLAPDIDWYESPDNFVRVATERKTRMGSVYNVTVIDLQGRTLTQGISLNATNGFTGVRNGSVNGYISAFGTTCSLYNVIGTLNVQSQQGCTVNVESSHITFTQDPVGLILLYSRDSHIITQGNPGIDTSVTALNISGGIYQGFLGTSSPYVKSKNVVFEGVRIEGSNAWKLNRLWMHNCTGDVKIDLYPQGSNSDYAYEIDFQNNILLGAGRIWFTGVFSATAPKNDMAGNVKFGICRIVGNSFYGGTGGIKMLREHPYTFTHFMADSVGPWEYTGNVGDCPVLKPARVGNSSTFSQAKKSAQGLPIQWLVSDNTFNAWAPYQNAISQGIPTQAQAGDGIEDSMAELVDSVGGSAYPKNIVWGWSCGLPSPADLMDEDQNNQFTEYLCLTWDLATISVPNGITRFP